MYRWLRLLEEDPIKDPLCRFIFIDVKHSRSELFITKEMLKAALTYHQVMPSFLGFIMPFGKQDRAVEAKFGGFRYEMDSGIGNQCSPLPQLGRSGQRFQLCYNLGSVEPSNGDLYRPWSIRQTALHHSFDIETGRTTWIIIKGNQLIKTRVLEATSTTARQGIGVLDSPSGAFASSLSLHLLICGWSNEDWRWYINYLEEEVENTTNHAKCLDPDSHEYAFEELQSTQHLEEKTDDAFSILKMNVTVLTELNAFYMNLFDFMDHSEPIIRDCKDDVPRFSRRVLSIVHDMQLSLARLESLLRLLSGRKSLLFSILDYRNAQASKKMAQKNHVSAVRMEKLTQQMSVVAVRTEKETVAMRIITLIATFFLPGTFILASDNTFREGFC